MAKIEYRAFNLPNSHLGDMFTISFAVECVMTRKKETVKGMNSVMWRNHGKNFEVRKLGVNSWQQWSGPINTHQNPSNVINVHQLIIIMLFRHLVNKGVKTYEKLRSRFDGNANNCTVNNKNNNPKALCCFLLDLNAVVLIMRCVRHDLQLRFWL